MMTKPLVWTIVFSMCFFYVDYTQFPCFERDRLKDIMILIGIIAGLLMIHGFNKDKPLTITSSSKVAEVK